MSQILKNPVSSALLLKPLGVSHSQSEFFIDEINQLFSTNTFEEKSTSEDLPFDTSLRAYSETYIVNGAALQVNYSHKRVKEILHPSNSTFSFRKI